MPPAAGGGGPDTSFERLPMTLEIAVEREENPTYGRYVVRL